MVIIYITLLILMVLLTGLITYFGYIKPLKEQIKKLGNALELKHEADKKRIEDKEEQGRQDPEEHLIDNLVIKTSQVRMGRKLSEYKISNKMTKFKDMDEAIGFGLEMTSRTSDPTIVNLSPYGCVMSTDYFLAFKLIMYEVFSQIKNLKH